MLESLFSNVADLKKKLQHRCFPVNIAIFLRTSFLNNICERLLLFLVHYDQKLYSYLDWLKAVKAFMILGMIANLVAVIYLVLAFIKEDIIFKIVGIFLAINGK